MARDECNSRHFYQWIREQESKREQEESEDD
jgi:hypothetical protein